MGTGFRVSTGNENISSVSGWKIIGDVKVGIVNIVDYK